MSKAELFDPTTTHFLPAYASGPGCAELWCWSPREVRDDRTPAHAGGEHQLLRAQHHRLALTLDRNGPLLRGVVVVRALRLGVAPVVELHDLGVGLEPVGDLVLRREHRPVVRELQVRQVVVPDGVVQAEALVAAAPLVAGASTLVDDDGRHAELPQPRREADATLAAADHEHVRLLGDTEFRRLLLAFLGPRRAALVGAVLRALRPGRATGFLVTRELVEGREQRPGPRAVVGAPQPQLPAPAADGRLELDPRLGDAVRRSGFLAVGDPPPARCNPAGDGGDEVTHRVPALGGGDVPGERDQVTPVAVVDEQGGDGVTVGGRQGALERREPGLDVGTGLRLGGAVEGGGHGRSSRRR